MQQYLYNNSLLYNLGKEKKYKDPYFTLWLLNYKRKNVSLFNIEFLNNCDFDLS
jgi:hypothetical protein